MTIDRKTQIAKARKKKVDYRKAAQPERIPVGLRRDVVNIYNKDPAFHYVFVKDTDEGGGTIQRYLQGGYEFVDASSHGTPVTHTHASNNLGSIIRISAGRNFPGEWLYGMRIRREWHEKDIAAEQAEIDKIDDMIHRRGPLQEKLRHEKSRETEPVYYDALE